MSLEPIILPSTLFIMQGVLKTMLHMGKHILGKSYAKVVVVVVIYLFIICGTIIGTS